MSKLELGPEANNSLQLLGYLQHNNIEIPETGYNSFGKYKYPLLDDILKAIQPFLEKYKCIVMWSEDDHCHDRYEDEEGNNYLFTDSIVTCRIQCIENINDYVQTQSHGAGLNKNSDKTLKAETIGRRFSLMCLLGMQKLKAEDTDDSEYDVRGQSVKSRPMSFKEKMANRRTDNKRQKGLM